MVVSKCGDKSIMLQPHAPQVADDPEDPALARALWINSRRIEREYNQYHNEYSKR